MINKSLLICLLGLLSLFGIYRSDVPVEEYLALGKKPEFDCVGVIYDFEKSGYTGSFVMIDSLHLISCAHCFIHEDYKDSTMVMNGATYTFKVVTGSRPAALENFEFEVKGKRYTGKTLTIHPTYWNKGADLAIIELSEPVKKISFPVLSFETDELGDTVTGVGFGVSGPANRAELVNSYHLKIAGMNVVDSVDQKNHHLVTDFDSPVKADNCNKLGSPEPLPLEYGIGGGDSGGGLFRTRNGKVQLIGISSQSLGLNIENLRTSRGYYGILGGYARVSSHKEWIRNISRGTGRR
ncbi:MAG: trypsin-like serine protease [Bacteroidota bacterium]